MKNRATERGHKSIVSEKIGFIVFLFTFFCNYCFAGYPKASQLECGGVTVRLTSYCKMNHKENQLSCSKQVLIFENQRTHRKISKLLQTEVNFLGSPISEWTCIEGHTDKYIEVIRCLAGNCDIGNAVEFEVWSLKGDLLIPYDTNFSRKVKGLGIVSFVNFQSVALTE